MARNGSTSVIDFDSILQQSAERATRLKELGKQHDVLQKARQQLDKDEAAFMTEIQSLGLGKVFKATRQTAKAATKGDKASAKTGAKRGRKPKTEGDGRSMPLHDVLLTVMPASEAEGISKDDIVTLVAGEGYISKATDPKVVIGQALGKSNHFSNPARGQWRLTKLGERARDKLFETAVEDAAGTAKAAQTATNPAPVAQAPATPAMTAEERLAQTNAAAADATTAQVAAV